KVLRALFGSAVVRLHGSRDYFSLVHESIQYEFVPVLRIALPKDAQNITDASPLHVTWVQKHLKKNPALADDIILAKAFCKAQRVYGAESFLKGFSGHVLDILIIHYQGFVPFLEHAQNWNDTEVIDHENHHKGRVRDELNASKMHSPLILVDPIQPDRNAAAALDNSNYCAFKKAAHDFLAKPSLSFFARKKITLAQLRKKKGTNTLLVIEVVPPEGKKDVVGCKLLKIFEFFTASLAEHEFAPLGQGWEWDGKNHAFIWLILDSLPLPASVEIPGPPVTNAIHAARFKKAHPRTTARKGRLYAREPRPFRTPEPLITSLLTTAYVKERCRSISLTIYTKTRKKTMRVSNNSNSQQ
ncbi:hypothetical protein COY95_00845, partial [Candidatus Woesearchaeota archaeon CG_4_10_14_0_8_um_filter_47_5]